jgi:hypothetical protein
MKSVFPLSQKHHIISDPLKKLTNFVILLCITPRIFPDSPESLIISVPYVFFIHRTRKIVFKEYEKQKQLLIFLNYINNGMQNCKR